MIHVLSSEAKRVRRKYGSYKESNIAWIGKVPVHWDVLPMKRLDKNNMEMAQTGPFGSHLHASDYMDSDLKNGVPLILIKHVNDFKIIDHNMPRVSKSKAEELSVYKLKKNDIVFSRVGTMGRVAPVTKKEEGWLISGQMLRLRIKSKDIDNQFLLYLLSSDISTKYLQLVSVGSTRDSINTDILRNMVIVRPSLPEQQAIANFLDRETGKLDRLVEKKQRLIELLREKRQALITQAVTKGLNPNVPMKDSGIEWLGEVPEHWKVLKIKWLSKVKRGASPRPIEDPIYFDNNGEYAWVRIADVTSSNMYLKKTSQTLSELGASLSVKLPPGKLFLSIAGSVGKPCISGIKCCIHDGFVYFPDLQENEKFFYYVFASGAPYGGLGKLGTQLNLNTDIVGDIYTGVPEIKEQLEIVKYLDNQTSKIDTLISKLQTQITKIKEYRQALISAAVTGKIDVQEKVQA
ncbi:type I restriction-modification system specificity determinant [Desmospora sp. 8437]|nr:type I restriction-modification system specificity determinant [Desmospora sp. 8437]